MKTTGRAGDSDSLGVECALRGAELIVSEVFRVVVVIVFVGVVCLCLALLGPAAAGEASSIVTPVTTGGGGRTLGLDEADLLLTDALGLVLRARIGAAA